MAVETHAAVGMAVDRPAAAAADPRVVGAAGVVVEAVMVVEGDDRSIALSRQ
jgi:hypothetical protein